MQHRDVPRLMRGTGTIDDFDVDDLDSWWQTPGKPSVLPYPGNPTNLDGFSVPFPCENLRIYHRDTHISCDVAIPVIWPSELKVVVSVQFEKNRDGSETEPVSAERRLLNEYIK